MLTACCVTAPFALLIPLTTRGPGLALFAVGVAVLEAGIVICNVIVNSFRQRHCDRALLGRVVASTRTLSYGSGAAGALLGGALASAIGLRAGVVVVCFAQLLGAGSLLLGPFREHRELPGEPEPGPAAERSQQLLDSGQADG